MKTTCLLIVLLQLCCAVDAQYNFRHYQVENGLSNNAVLCSLQDDKGFLWFGTKDGLNRFDGYSFKVFQHTDLDSGSIGSNFIHSIYEDPTGVIWAGTDEGLYRYHAQRESFSLLPGTAGAQIRDILMDRKGILWYIASGSLRAYDPKTGKQLFLDNTATFPAASICIMPAGELWVASVEGSLKKFDYATGKFSTYIPSPQLYNPNGSQEVIEKIYPKGDHALFIGTVRNGVNVYDTRTGSCKDILCYNKDHSEIYVRDILQTAPGEYWIATESGVKVYRELTGEVISLQKKSNDPYSLSDNAIYTLCQDREGSIWCGTYFGGVNLYPHRRIAFDLYFPRSGENAISGNAVREICRDRLGNLWVGTEDAGLNERKQGSGEFIHYAPDIPGHTISYTNIHALLPDSNRLWVGTFEHGLDALDIRTGKMIRHYQAKRQPGDLSSNFVYCMLRTREGRVYAGTALGLDRYNPVTDDFSPVPGMLNGIFITSMLEDHTGRIWIATMRDGLYYLDPATGRTARYQYDGSPASLLPGNRVNSVAEDSSHRLWICTEAGITLFDPARGTATHFNEKNGLPGNIVYKILFDDAGLCWMSTSRGLVSLDPVSGEMHIYTTANGLLNDQFNYNSAFRDRGDTLYFGSVKGMIRFHPGNGQKRVPPAPVYLTGIQVLNKELTIDPIHSPLKTSIIYTGDIVLHHDQSSFSLDFAALSYLAPEMTSYMYTLTGFEKDWTWLKTNRRIYYTQLPPGNYTFLVKASTNDKVWGEPAQLHIRILPPWWAGTAAFLIYFVIVSLAAYAAIRYYLTRARARNRRKLEMLENEKQKELYHAKIEFFTNIAHEIKTPLTLIKLPLENVLKETHIPETINENLLIMEKNTNRLLELTNQLLDFRRTEKNDYSLSFVKSDICDLLREIVSGFKPAADQQQLHLRIELPRMPFQAYVDPEAFTKIVTNLTGNAVKYADTEVIVSVLPFSSDDDSFTIKLVNDGYPIPEEARESIFEPFYRLKKTEKQPGTGIGLALVKTLTELHKGTIRCVTEGNKNVFLLRLPIHQEKEFEFYSVNISAPHDAVNKTAIPLAGEHKDERPAILLVEDNKEILQFEARQLRTDYFVYLAGNGEEAIEILNREVVNLVISDIMMPVMDGLELCKIIKSNFEYSHIPVILLTAKNTLQSRILGLGMGADAYIGKPFSQEHLQAQIHSLLVNRNRVKQYFASVPMANINTIAYSKSDENFLLSISDIIHKHMRDPLFGVEQLARAQNMSRPTLYRKIKALANMSPTELINVTRLKWAAEKLLTGEYKIYEIAELIGYSESSNFSRDFTRQFSMSPTEYILSRKKEATKTS